MSNLIALIGPKGSGKTLLSKYLESKYNYTPTSFATPIKLMLETLLSYQNLDKEIIHHMLYGNLKEEETEYLGWRSPRYAMQTLGTEWRILITRNLWVNIWENKTYSQLSRGEKISIDDVRFLHEAEAIKNLGGKIILISRQGYNPSITHTSEHEYLKITQDETIYNDTTPEDMYLQIDTYLTRVG